MQEEGGGRREGALSSVFVVTSDIKWRVGQISAHLQPTAFVLQIALLYFGILLQNRNKKKLFSRVVSSQIRFKKPRWPVQSAGTVPIINGLVVLPLLVYYECV